MLLEFMIFPHPFIQYLILVLDMFEKTAYWLEISELRSNKKIGV